MFMWFKLTVFTAINLNKQANVKYNIQHQSVKSLLKLKINLNMLLKINLNELN